MDIIVSLRGVSISTAVKEPALAIAKQQMNIIRDSLAKADKVQATKNTKKGAENTEKNSLYSRHLFW